MKKFGQFKYITLFCLIFSCMSCFAEWCGVARDTNKTAYCVNSREECKDNKDYFCVAKSNSRALESNQLPSKLSPDSYGDIQYCTYWRDSHKVVSCHNNRDDCRENMDIYCRVVKVK
jgi:hypothetical protein